MLLKELLLKKLLLKKLLLINKRKVALIVFLTASASLAVYADNEVWQEQTIKQKSARNHVTLFFKSLPHSKTPEFKATTTVNASIDSVLAVLLDKTVCHQWVHQCEEALTVYTINDREQIIYQVNDLPFMKNRDVLLHARLDVMNNGKTITITLKSSPDFCTKENIDALQKQNPNQSKTFLSLKENCKKIKDGKHVRVQEAQGFYELETVAAGIEVTWQQHLELGGLFPTWLIKSKLADLPTNTLMALHEMVQKDPYREADLSSLID